MEAYTVQLNDSPKARARLYMRGYCWECMVVKVVGFILRVGCVRLNRGIVYLSLMLVFLNMVLYLSILKQLFFVFHVVFFLFLKR